MTTLVETLSANSNCKWSAIASPSSGQSSKRRSGVTKFPTAIYRTVYVGCCKAVSLFTDWWLGAGRIDVYNSNNNNRRGHYAERELHRNGIVAVCSPQQQRLSFNDQRAKFAHGCPLGLQDKLLDGIDFETCNMSVDS